MEARGPGGRSGGAGFTLVVLLRSRGMSDVRDPDTDQPLPQPGRIFIHQAVIDELGEHGLEENVHYAIERGLIARRDLGVRKYGVALQSHNGRDALQECWEEALDLLVYSYQLDAEDGAGALVQDVLNVVEELARRRIERGDVELL